MKLKVRLYCSHSFTLRTPPSPTASASSSVHDAPFSALASQFLCWSDRLDFGLFSPDVEFGIPYAKKLIGCTSKTWDTFFNYLTRTWLKQFPPKYWNVHCFIEEKIQLINRTNNPVERYNRKMNELFKTKPSLPQFVEGIRVHANDYVKLIEDIKKGQAKPPSHQTHVQISIPEEYQKFKDQLISQRK